jgi:hypothetical protein
MLLQNSCRCYRSVVVRIVTARGLCTNQNPFPKRRSKGLSTFLTAGTPLLLFLIGGSFFLSQFMDTHMELKVLFYSEILFHCLLVTISLFFHSFTASLLIRTSSISRLPSASLIWKKKIRSWLHN